MTFQEANKNSKDLICRNNLTYDGAKKRLQQYFSEEEVADILIQATGLTSWTDGNIVVICTDKTRRKYSIVAVPSLYMGLIEP